MRPALASWLRQKLTDGQLRFLKFGIVGSSGVVVNYVFLKLGLVLFGGFAAETRRASAFALGIGLSLFTNFVLNDRWTWGDRSKGARTRDFFRRMFGYFVANGLGAGIQWSISTSLALYAGLGDLLAMGAGIIGGMCVNFIMNHLWIFRDQDDPSP